MTNPEPTTATNLNRYDDTPMPWSVVLAALNETYPDPPGNGKESHTVLGTVRPDGRPHAAQVGAVWVDGAWYFVSSPVTQKSRNLAVNPACTLTAKLPGFDVVFNGEVERVTDPRELQRVATYYKDSGWPAEVEGDAFTAPYMAQSGGPPPWHLFRLACNDAVAVGTSDATGGAMKWTFT